MGHIFAHVTCTRTKWEVTTQEMAEMDGATVEETRTLWADDVDYDSELDIIRLNDPIEESGWVDVWWNLHELRDHRSDVKPFVSEDEDSEDLAEEVRAALGWLEGGYEDNGDGTFYAYDSDDPYSQPWSYRYAIHFTRKDHQAPGRPERPWHPARDGGIAL